MATETTMGARILAAAEAYDMAASALRGRTTFPQEANASANAALADLRALCARADAAERGMVASVRRDLASQEWYRHSWLGSEAKGAAKDAADAEYTEALAAWRALGEVQS